MVTGTRFAIFISVALTLWTVEHLYVGWRLLSLPVLAGPLASRLVKATLALGFLAYPLARCFSPSRARSHVLAIVPEYLGAVWIGLVFLLFAFLLLSHTITLGDTVLRPYSSAIHTGAAILALVAAGAGWIGGHRSPRTVAVEAVIPGLPAERDGLVVVQVSDLHLGTLLGERSLRTVIDLVDAAEPDLVAVTGDLVDAELDTLRRLLPLLRQLRAPEGVFVVSGNHEYYAGIDGCRRLFNDAGYTYLENSHVEVVPGLVVAGVPDTRGCQQTGKPGADLGAALSGISNDPGIILLRHSPTGEQEAAAAGVGLMLCGHTHGGQLWPFHYLVRCDWPQVAGIFRVGAMTQVISRGAGRWGPPMRLFAPSDIVRITLRSPSPSLG